MKIKDIKAIPLKIPSKTASAAVPINKGSHDVHVLVKVFTDEGITGYGEAFRFPPEVVCSAIEKDLKPRLIGQDPTQIEKLWDMMYQKTIRYGRKGVIIHAISGIEIALWDILGKYRKIPAYEMLGGRCKDRLRSYASLPPFKDTKDTAAIVAHYADEGYTAIKLHEHNANMASVARKAVGPGVTLMFDISGRWAPKEAVVNSKKLEEAGIYWLEEPVSTKENNEGLAFVRERVSILVAAGENEYTHYGFRDLITRGAVDIVQPNPIKTGGILACRKIYALAEAFHLQIANHSNCFGPGFAATLHLAASNPRFEFIETGVEEPDFPYIQPDLRPVKGFITLPDKPGLGIEIDEKVVKKYSFS